MSIRRSNATRIKTGIFVSVTVSIVVRLGAKPAQAEGLVTELSCALDHSSNAFALAQSTSENRVPFDTLSSSLFSLMMFDAALALFDFSFVTSHLGMAQDIALEKRYFMVAEQR